MATQLWVRAWSGCILVFQFALCVLCLLLCCVTLLYVPVWYSSTAVCHQRAHAPFCFFVFVPCILLDFRIMSFKRSYSQQTVSTFFTCKTMQSLFGLFCLIPCYFVKCVWFTYKYHYHIPATWYVWTSEYQILVCDSSSSVPPDTSLRVYAGCCSIYSINIFPRVC